MYAAIYGYGKAAGYREHLGNVLSIEETIAEKTFDFGSGTIKGSCESNITKGLIYVINTESGRHLFSGFAKNIKPESNTSIVEFKSDDFKKVFDTEIFLDFTQESLPSHALKDIFQMVCNQVSSVEDPFISELTLQFEIPDDNSDTKVIADYTGRYIIVNAAQFLKVYLSWFGYSIFPSYSEVSDSLVLEFRKANTTPIEIKLKDFTHEKTSNDIKTNKAIATIKFDTTSDDPSWEASTLEYYNSNPENRAQIIGTETPDPTGYTPGFALKLIEAFSFVGASSADYSASEHKFTRFTPWNDVNPPTSAPPLQTAISACGNPNLYGEGAVVKVVWIDSNNGIVYSQYPTYIKTTPSTVSYYKLNDYTYLPRPSLPQKIYTLGKDNNIYSGYAPDSLRLYPIVSKIFEAAYLSEAQVNAVFEIVNNRYIENILITAENVSTPIDLASLDLYSMIRVFDNLGEYKDIPISEKTTTHSSSGTKCVIKLGFKKTLLTEIIKNDIGTEDVVKQSGGGSAGTSIIKEELPVWEGELAPDTEQYKTWFKPLTLEEQ